MSLPGTSFSRYVCLAVAAICGYFFLPPSGQNVAFIASNLVATCTIVTAWWHFSLRPTVGWLLLAAFTAATAVGNTVYFVNDSILHVQPFPSFGDAAFLVAYLLLAAGLMRIQHARTGRPDLSAVLDTAIVTVGFAAASWVVFMAPLLRDSESSMVERLTALGYPVADVLVLAVAARFFLTSRRRGAVFGWLAGTVLCMLVADTIFAVLNFLGIYSTGHPIDALILTYNFGWGAVALHRCAKDLALPSVRTSARPSWWRLAALTTASLVAPGVLVVQVLRDQYTDVVITACASALLFLLVVMRMAGLVRTLEMVLTERQALETELEHRAHHDDLTGLANRGMFTTQVEASLRRLPIGGTKVLYLDLDRFKTVNDSLGHAAGDTLLTVTANRLRAGLHPGDTIARLGGDEFAVLLGDEPAGRSLFAVKAILTDALATPIPLHGLDLQVSASIGTAEARAGDTMEDLMHRADTAMYIQKSRVDRRSASATPTVPAVSKQT